MDDLREFKEYFCKFRCEYRNKEPVIEHKEPWFYCSDCQDYSDRYIDVEIKPCDYCQIDKFVEIHELENMQKTC